MWKRFIGSWVDLRTLPRELWILALATFVNRLGTMALPFLALFLTQDRGLPATQAGAILAVYGVVALIVGPIAGRLSDRFSAVRVMEVTLTLSALTVMLYPWCEGPPALIAVTTVFALAMESFRPANSAVVSDIASPRQLKTAYALQRLAINLGMSVGPAVGGWLARKSYSPLFFINGVALLSAAAILRFSVFHRIAERKPKHVVHASAEGRLSRIVGTAGRDRAFRLFLLAVAPTAIVFFQHMSTLPLFMAGTLRLSPAVFGSVMAINTLLIACTEIPLNSATAHWPHRRSLRVGAAFLAVGFGGMIFVDRIWGIAVTVAIWTIGEMILFPAMSAYVAEISPLAKRGEYMGMYMMTFSVGFMLGPLIGTQLLQGPGPRTLWAACLIMGGLSTLLFSKVGEKGPMTA